jgi:predicted ATPase
MKINSLHIKNHYQFRDLELDLTYPKGHDKAGEPLDKVCFIGQSGTGKTTLLEEIWNILVTKGQMASIPQQVQDISFTIAHKRLSNYDKSIFFEFLVELKKEAKKAPLTINDFKIIEKPTLNSYINSNYEHEYHEYIKTYNPTNTLKEYQKIYFHLASNNKSKLNESQYLFPLSIKQNGWENIIEKIQLHQKVKIKHDSEISNAYREGNLELAQEYADKLDAWEKANDTPLLDLANNYLNKILLHFNLKVKTALESLDEIHSIHLVNLETLETIPLQNWSSGIKNIISRTIPLYTHKFENAIICIDEPETSLYPDIQRKIIDIYTELAPNNQFFFATHSPIIASSFEPWEIVELKFDKDGYVYRDQYWEGENHVDNYKYDPRYLRWDAILQNIFDLENDGSDERKEMLQDFANLDNKLKERKKKGEKLSKEDPEVKELMEMGKKLGWDTKQSKA